MVGNVHDHTKMHPDNVQRLNGRARTRNGAACRRFAAPRASFRQILGYVHTESTFSSLRCSIQPTLTPPCYPAPRSDRLKWFVFDLTTTAVAAAAAAAVAFADGGTLFPPRAFPSFNVSRGNVCAKESHALLVLGIRDRETPLGLSMILVCMSAEAGRILLLS